MLVMASRVSLSGERHVSGRLIDADGHRSAAARARNPHAGFRDRRAAALVPDDDSGQIAVGPLHHDARALGQHLRPRSAASRTELLRNAARPRLVRCLTWRPVSNGPDRQSLADFQPVLVTTDGACGRRSGPRPVTRARTEPAAADQAAPDVPARIQSANCVGGSVTIGQAHQPLRSLVCDELRRQVITGELAPGTRLVEDRLAAQLGVSRNPVREALQTLSGEGFVVILPRRGAVVADVTADHAEELFDVRMALEPLAARLAARNADATAIVRLRAVLERARTATEARELDVLAACNTEFHQLVVAAGGNDYLSLLVAPMARRVQWVFRASAASRAPHSWTEHEALLTAISDGNEEYASVLASAHVAAARTSYRRLAGRPAAACATGDR